MHIKPPQNMRPIAPLASRPSRRRRLLRPMLLGSLLLHLLLLLAIYLRWPEDTAEAPPTDSDQVAITFDTPTGSQQASTATPNPTDKPAVAAGSSAAPEAVPTPDNSAAPPGPPPTPTPPDPSPPVPVPPTQTPPVATETPPVPETPPPPVQTPPSPQPPATVSLNPDDEADSPPPPPFQMPQPPPPLPPLPRPPPRIASRPTPRNPFAAPQNWSFNAAPSQEAPGRPSRGFDMSVSNQGGPDTASLGYVSGAKPSGDWMSALRKWVDVRKYYPEQAIAQLEQGNVSLLIDIDRSGRVLSVQLAGTSRSQFLDGAFQDLFRRATVPPFTPDMTEQTTTLRATMHFRLIAH